MNKASLTCLFAPWPAIKGKLRCLCLLLTELILIPFASRISKYFAHSHVLVSIRNQLEAIESHYSNEGRVPKGTKSSNDLFVPFREYLDHYLCHPDDGFFRSLDYLSLINALTHFFSREHMLNYYSRFILE